MLNLDKVYILNNNYLIYIRSYEKYILKDLKLSKYYIVDSYKFNNFFKNSLDNLKLYNQTTFKSINYLYFILGLIFIPINYLEIKNYHSTPNSYLLNLTWFILNIFIHEVAHAITLKKFGGRVSKIGFRLQSGLPSFYIDTSDTYLLNKTKRSLIYLSGCISNLILNGSIGYLLIKIGVNIQLSCISFFYIVLLNLLPFINSDGYNLFLLSLDGLKINNKVVLLNPTKNKKLILTIQEKLDKVISISIYILIIVTLFKLFK